MMVVVITACHKRRESTTLEVLCKYDIISTKYRSKQIADVVINLRPKKFTIQSTFRKHSYIKRKKNC